jgi:cell division protein FtsA
MKNGQIITAIDIGTTKICVIIAIINSEGKLEVRGIGTSKSSGLLNGVAIDIMKASRAINEAITEAETKADLKAKNIHIGIAGEHIRSQNTLGRISLTSGDNPSEITREDIENVINNAKNNVKIQQGNEKLDIIHAIPQYYSIDDQEGIINPLKMSGFNLSAYIHIVMADLNSIRNITKCVEICGYKVEDLFLEPIASSYAVLNEVETELGSIIIDIGGGTTDIAVFYKGSIRYSAVLPLGGTNITQDLAIGLHTTPQNAEEIKTEVGNTISESVPEDEVIEVLGIAGRDASDKKLRYVSEIIEARMREILESAYELLNENNNLKMITAGITLTGGASLLKNLDYLTEGIFNMSAKIGYPDLSKLSGSTERLSSPRFATSVGILYQAYANLEDETFISSKPRKDPFLNFFQKIIDYFKENI